MLLIGLSGKIQCGKSHTAKMFEKIGFKRLSFGDVLKEECSNIYGYPLLWNYQEKYKANKIINHVELPRPNMTLREVLEWHGTDYRRAQDPNYWIDRMNDTLTKIVKSKVPLPIAVVIDDVRFPNEACYMHDSKGVLVRIDPYDGYNVKEPEHESETLLDDYEGFDFRFKPDFGELENQVFFPIIKYLIGVK